jgi:hypothetical protein
MPLLVAVLAGCTSGSPEEAVSTSTIADPAGDVVVSGLGKDRETVASAPQSTQADILTTTVEHRADEIGFVVALRDLLPGQYLDLTANVTTDSTGSRLPTQVTSLTYDGESTIDVYRTDGSSRCPAADVAVDHDADTVTMTVPRTCLGDPRWIEATVVAATMQYDATPAGPRGDAVWEDDAYRTGQAEPAASGTSGRLHRP